jgi:hypothetical protein
MATVFRNPSPPAVVPVRGTGNAAAPGMRVDGQIHVMAAFAAATATLLSAPPPELRDGDVLGPVDGQAARGLLPEEILEHYRTREDRNRILDLTQPGLHGIGNHVPTSPDLFDPHVLARMEH